MRSVRSFHFDKAAASVLTTCVSPRGCPRPCPHPSHVAGTPQISPFLPADGDVGAGLPLPGVPPGQFAAAQVHREAAGGARRRGQGRGRQAGWGQGGTPRGSRSPLSPRPHRHVPVTASPSSWHHRGCTPVAVSWLCREPMWLGHCVPKVSVSPRSPCPQGFRVPTVVPLTSSCPPPGGSPPPCPHSLEVTPLSPCPRGLRVPTATSLPPGPHFLVPMATSPWSLHPHDLGVPTTNASPPLGPLSPPCPNGLHVPMVSVSPPWPCPHSPHVPSMATSPWSPHVRGLHMSVVSMSPRSLCPHGPHVPSMTMSPSSPCPHGLCVLSMSVSPRSPRVRGLHVPVVSVSPWSPCPLHGHVPMVSVSPRSPCPPHYPVPIGTGLTGPPQSPCRCHRAASPRRRSPQ